MDGNFFASLHEKYEENASQWSLDFTQQDFFISGELIQNLDLIEMMEKDVAEKRNEMEDLKMKIVKKETELQKIREDQITRNADFQELEKLAMEFQNRQKDIEQRIGILATKQKEKQGTDEAKRASLKEYVTRAKQYLGLSIARTSTDSYILTFTNIDNRDLQRQFLCEIRVDGENKRSYKVLNSEPIIEDLKDMEKKLIESNNLSGFVVNLRKKFKQIVLKEKN